MKLTSEELSIHGGTVREYLPAGPTDGAEWQSFSPRGSLTAPLQCGNNMSYSVAPSIAGLGTSKFLSLELPQEQGVQE
jgi:hypothetical protein